MVKEMLRVSDLEASLQFDSCDFIVELCGYGKEKNVFKTIDVIADFHVANSWVNWYEFARDNTDEVNDVITKVGWEALGKNIVNAARMAQYFKYKEDMADCVEDGLKLYALSYYKKVYGDDVLFMPYDLWDDLELAISGIPEHFYEITDLIDNYDMAIAWQ